MTELKLLKICIGTVLISCIIGMIFVITGRIG